jgi:cytochrome c biogenesis protein CcmG, thiol:disulfide interchange protein DsbE
MRRDGERRPLRLRLMVPLFGALLALTGCQSDPSWKLGTSAPEASLLDQKDATVQLSSYRGKVVVLRFWASGCKQCVAGMPAMDRYLEKYRDKGVTVVGVNMGDSREVVEGFLKKMQLSYPVLRDPVLIAAKKYHVTSIPTTFFIDRKGTARLVVPGEVSQKVFDKEVAALL